MEWVLLSECKRTDVLAEDVKDAMGRLLCAKGTELNSAVVDRLNRRGITKVPIATEDVCEFDPVRRAEIEAAITKRFQAAGDDPVLSLLRTSVTRAFLGLDASPVSGEIKGG